MTKKKHRINLALITLILFLTYKKVLSDGDLKNLPQIFKDLNKAYLLGASIDMGAFFLAQALAIKILLKNLGFDQDLFSCFRYTIIDYYFSMITPGASGGQPAEIYLMKKDQIPVGVSSLVMLIFNMCYHLAVVLVIALSSFGYLGEILPGQGIYRKLFFLGISIQGILVISYFFIIFSKKLVYRLVDLVFNFFEKLGLKKLVKYRENAEGVLRDYKEGACRMAKNPRTLLVCLLIAIFHIFLLYSQGFFIAGAFGKKLGLRQMAAYQGIITMTFESLPIPGGAGVSEIGFLEILGKIYGKDVKLAMLVSRAISFYFFLGLGFLMTFLTKGRAVKEDLEKRKFLSHLEDRLRPGEDRFLAKGEKLYHEEIKLYPGDKNFS